jgi:tellurite resistance protein
MEYKKRLRHFSVSFFSIILGLAGLTLVLEKMAGLLGTSYLLPKISLGFTVVVFLTIGMFFAYRELKYPEEVKKEYMNSIKYNFFSTISIGLLLLSAAFLAYDMRISKILWVSGTVLHIFFTYRTISFWMFHKEHSFTSFNPIWFIPVVGNLLIPVSGTAHFSNEISWFFFSIGLIFWIVLFSTFMYRIIFHEALAEKIVPSLAILIAPPAIGFISYVKLTGGVDGFARIMYYFALFLFTFVFGRMREYMKMNFYLSWWAFSFPISSFTIATVLMYHKSGMVFFRNLSFATTLFLIVMIMFTTIRTLLAVKNRELCVPE